MQLLPKVKPEDKRTFELEDYYFHYINEAEITVLCMTDKELSKKTAFAFLQQLRNEMSKQYTTRQIENARAYQLTTFTDKIRECIVSIRNLILEILQRQSKCRK